MKKISILILTFFIILLIFFVPFNQQKKLHINVQFFIALQQLLQPENWKRWQPDVKNAWQHKPAEVKISKLNTAFTIRIPGLAIHFSTQGFTFYVDKNSTFQTSGYQFTAVPVLKDGTTDLTINQKTTLWNNMLGFFGWKPDHDLDQLKNFLEDPRRYYGFDIRKTTVADSNIVVEKRTVWLQNKASEIARAQHDLQNFVRQQNLKIMQPFIADIRPVGKDSIRLMIGLPVDRQAVSTGQVQLMHQPPHGHMLIGFYNGRYGDRQKLYLAMKTYITDHHLSSPEDAYEKYLDNKIPVSDTSFVHLQVNFPIF